GVFGFAVCVGAGSFTYVYFRNQRVPEAKRVLTEEHLRSLARQYLKLKMSDNGETDREGKPRIPVRFFARGGDAKEEDRELVARVESSKGYRAALKMVLEAVRKRATDIHLEPAKEEMTVRFRIDGILHASDPFSRAAGDGVVNIFKVLCNMDITEKRKPQDGA